MLRKNDLVQNINNHKYVGRVKKKRGDIITVNRIHEPKVKNIFGEDRYKVFICNSKFLTGLNIK